MLHDNAFDDFFDDFLACRIEARGRLELKSEVIVRPALILIEEESIGAGPESDGEPTEHIGRRLSSPRFIAAKLGDMHTGLISQRLLRHATLLTYLHEML